jgi:hypothetical protein
MPLHDADDSTPEIAAEEVTLSPASEEPIQVKRQRAPRRTQVH